MPTLNVTVFYGSKGVGRLSQTRPTLLEKVLLAATEKAVLYSGGTSKWQSSTSGLKKEVLDNSVDQTLD